MSQAEGFRLTLGIREPHLVLVYRGGSGEGGGVSWSVAGTARCGNAQLCARRVTTDRGNHVMHIGLFAISYFARSFFISSSW